MAKDLHKKFRYRKIKRPLRPLAWIIQQAFKVVSKKRNVKFVYDQSFLPLKKKQVLYICQHTSHDDYMYVLAGVKHLHMHFVCGYQNIFQKYLYTALLHSGVIAKFLYQPDMQATKQILSAAKSGGSIILFPEGIQSTSGSSHPINPATMKLLEKLKLPVVLVKFEGAYLARTRYSTDVKKGKITATFSKLFDPSDFDKFDSDTLYQKLLTEFKYDEFENNKRNRTKFIGKEPNISGLDTIIYKCPHCLGEGVFSTEGDTMTCSSCGFKVRMDEYYDIHAENKFLPFENTDLWYKWQREQIKKEILKDDFSISTKVEIQIINTQKLDNDYSLKVMGEGVLTLNNKELIYQGTYDGQEVTMNFDVKSVYSLVMSLIYKMDLYYKNDYYAFKLLDNKKLMIKWMLAAEEIHNLYDKAWQKVSDEVYDVAQ